MNRKKFYALMVAALSIVTCLETKAQNLWQPWYIEPRSGSQHLDLNGKWELSYLDQPIEKLSQLDKRKDPFETNIPSSIHWSLYNGGKLPHPYYNKNSSLYAWTDAKVWYYKKTFDFSGSAENNYVLLCFDGIDYFSKVWLNDSLLGVHEGMFGGPSVEVSRLIKPGRNEIIVELKAGDWGNKPGDYDKLPLNSHGEIDYSKRGGYNPRKSGKIIKPWVISGGSGGEMFFSLGMWQGVRMEIVPKVHLERPYLVTTRADAGLSTIHLSAEIFANEHSLTQQLHPWANAQIRHPDEKGVKFVPVKDKLSVLVEFISEGQKQFVKEIPVTAYEGRNWVEQDLTIANPKLWNPNGLGKPNLYTVRISLRKNGVVSDKHEFQYGIRVIDRVVSAGPRTGDRYDNWQFVINGKKIFVKGMNFTPQDILLDASEDRYRWTLAAAKKMGVQLIRIWGGGLIETDNLYRICDEMGIMVWQDFPIGNQDTPEYPQEVWESQVVQNILRLRNHASLAVWCGGNEFNPYSSGNAMSIGILERNLRTFDNSRFFVRTTPDQGSIHVYPDMDPTWYSRSYGKEAWISETGMHSMPEANLFREVVDTTEFRRLGRMWDKDFRDDHKELILHFTEYGPSRVPRMLSRASHIADMTDPTIDAITEATQVGAGEFYQVLSEKTQANYPVTTGLMPWVFKRHWPVVAIQMMDWFGQAGAPYYFLKRTYEPTHISIDIERLIWAPGEKIALPLKVINSPSGNGGSYKATVTVYDDAFESLASFEKSVSVNSGTSVASVAAGSFQIPANYRDRFLLVKADLKDASGKLVSRSFYYPRSLSQMEDKAFYTKYISEPIAWITLEKGPWLKTTVARSATTLKVQVLGNQKLNEKESEIKVRVTNTGKVPAFMAKVDITGVKRAFYASDNYTWIQPGESKEIMMNVLWREENKSGVLEASAWNAAAVKQNL